MSDNQGVLDDSWLDMDLEAEATRIAQSIRETISGPLRRRGAVVGVSGGIDSALCAALCVKALGPERVFVLFMPEADSSPISLQLGRELAETFGVRSQLIDLEPTLRAAGCYDSQLEAVRTMFPDFGEGWGFKIVLPSIMDNNRLNVSRLVVSTPSGETKEARIPKDAYLQLVAATNFKQRTRTMFEYYWADKLHYAVCGTPNRLEYDQGFFVKGGDGLADFKPIAHLYKTQVYRMARHLGVPAGICNRAPTTDTFSIAQGQDEFYFALPYNQLDICLAGLNKGKTAAQIAQAVGLKEEIIDRVLVDIEAKRRATSPLHQRAHLVEPVPEIHYEAR
jgi:NAD+ synthase